MTVAIDSARNTEPAIGWVEALEGVPTDQIAPNPANPRTVFDAAAHAELVASVRQFGVLEPLLVRRILPAPKHGPAFALIAGERRLRAAAEVGVDVAVRVLDVDDPTALRIALVENLVRRDLDPIEEAAGYARLNREAGMKQSEIAAAVNRSQPAVANAMRLLDLPEEVRGRIRAGELSVSHGIALARWKAFPAVVSALAAIVVDQHVTSKDLEAGGLGRWGYELARQGALVSLKDNYELRFDQAVCAACPFSANVDGYCFRPAHARELHEAAAKVRQAEVQRQVATVREAGGTLVKLADLPYDTVIEFRGYRPRPPGCSEACPCAGQALARHGDEMVPVCTDPKRYRSLETAKTKAETKVRRSSARSDLERLLPAIDALAGQPIVLDGAEHRALALIVSRAWAHIQKPSAITEALQRHAPHLAGESVSDLRQDAYPLLALLPPETLLRLGLEAVLRAELAEVAMYGHLSPKRTRWWLDGGDDTSAELAAAAARMMKGDDDDQHHD